MARNLVRALGGAVAGLILGVMAWVVLAEVSLGIGLMTAQDSPHDYEVVANWIGIIFTASAGVLLMFWAPLRSQGARAQPGSRPWRGFLRRWTLRLGIGAGAFLAVAIIFNLISPRIRTVTAGLLGGERFSDYRPTRFWIGQLASQDAGDRSRAAAVLVHIPAAEAVAAVGECLRDDSSEVRLSAVNALGYIGPAAQYAAGDLAGLLKDKDPTVRLAAAKSLKQIGPAGCEAIPELLEVAKGPPGDAVSAAIDALAAMTPHSIPAIVQGLAAGGDNAAAFGRALEKAGPDAAPALLGQWKMSSGGTRRAIACVLAGLRPLPEAALPSVTELLRDGDQAAKVKALLALGGTGRQALPAVVPFLKDPDPEIKGAAAKAVGEMGPAAKSAAAAALAALVGDPDAGVRLRAAISLGRIGPAAKDAAASLQGALNDKEPLVSISAAVALWKVGGEVDVVVPVLMSMLKSMPRDSAPVEALGEIGPPARAAIPALIERLTTARNSDRSATAQAIYHIDPQTFRESAVPVIAGQLKSLLEKPGDRFETNELIRSIGKIGPDAEGAVPALCDALSSKDHWWAAESALASMGAAAKEAVPALGVLYARQDYGDRRETLATLSKIDPAAAARAAAWHDWRPCVLAIAIFVGLAAAAAALPAVIARWRGRRAGGQPSLTSAV
ncbi:MAG: HEAT repeat domain-containing protein [Thermoguttaceae bacterium]